MVLSPEEPALVLDMADRLIDLYEQRDAALNAGDAIASTNSKRRSMPRVRNGKEFLAGVVNRA